MLLVLINPPGGDALTKMKVDATHATFGQTRSGSVSDWRTSLRRTIFVVQTKIFSCETIITHTNIFLAPQIISIFRKFVSQNKGKNAGRSRKMRECGKEAKMRDFPHDCGMVDTYDIGEIYPAMKCGLSRKRGRVNATGRITKGAPIRATTLKLKKKKTKGRTQK